MTATPAPVKPVTRMPSSCEPESLVEPPRAGDLQPAQVAAAVEGHRQLRVGVRFVPAMTTGSVMAGRST